MPRVHPLDFGFQFIGDPLGMLGLKIPNNEQLRAI
jgi:hypothetical protein